VDQWDWEKIIKQEERNIETLFKVVRIIFGVFKTVEEYLLARYPVLIQNLPTDATFITSQELEDTYPNLTPKEREDTVCQQYKAVFIAQIGDTNSSGKKHDDRAPDYDDWTMNGDLFFYHSVLEKSLEMSSMGVRVNAESLMYQLKNSGCENRIPLNYHQDVLNNRLPLTIGGGLGQSRMCMYLLGKAHIGEVQSSVWPEEMVVQCGAAGISLL